MFADETLSTPNIIIFCGDFIWIGVDDTDSVKGGCTTYVAVALIKQLMDKGYNLIGYPRLVRLNPNIPWKTRGNGALAFQIGKGKGKTIQIGETNKKDIISYEKGEDDNNIDYTSLHFLIKKIAARYYKTQDVHTNPGLVLLRQQPERSWYLRAVQEIVTIKDILLYLNESKASYFFFKNGRGLIGATAAIAWSPQHDKTYELITYRNQTRWGTKRSVDVESVKQMDSLCPNTFDNYDYVNHHNRITPNSPCPILYGVRGERHHELIMARSLIKSEPVSGWVIFKTNQGTDEHLRYTTIANIQPYQSVVIQGSVETLPRTIPGGHVLFTVKDETGSIDCAAYEPTKQFRSVIRKLIIGDTVHVYGGIRERPRTVNIEKICIKRLVSQTTKIENPVCPVCGKHMKSQGTNQGYKCRRCHTTSTTPPTRTQQRGIQPGYYEVPVCARRHLSKPLKRM